MKNKVFILILFLPLFLLKAEENASSLSLQAAALMEARDYAAAYKIYEQLLAQPLPAWQQARILYNLGTLRLAQQQPVEALQFFQKIQPTELSLPSFGRDLFLNEGIAYLQQAQTALLAEQPIFIAQALKAFNQALQLECQLQKEENSSPCQSSLLLDQWLKTAHSQLNNVYQRQLQMWKEHVDQNSKDPLQQAHLNYATVLFQESLTVDALEKLIAHFDALEVEKNQTASLEQIKNHLKKSLEELKVHHPLQARFFLLAGFNSIYPLLEKSSSPAIILRQALEQAENILQMFLITKLTARDSSQEHLQAQMGAILKDQHQNMLTQVQAFIPAVLNTQNTLFHQAKDPDAACQQSPWNQVIPLYDRGYRSAQAANPQLDQLDTQTPLAYQEQTIQDWQQALKLILSPPQPSVSSASQKLTESFSLIQEMYLQDQPQPEPKIKEMHSW